MVKSRAIKTFNKQLQLYKELDKEVFICSNKLTSIGNKSAPRELYIYNIYSFIDITNGKLTNIIPDSTNFYLICFKNFFIANQNIIKILNSNIKHDIYTFFCINIIYWIYNIYESLTKILNNILYCLNIWK